MGDNLRMTEIAGAIGLRTTGPVARPPHGDARQPRWHRHRDRPVDRVAHHAASRIRKAAAGRASRGSRPTPTTARRLVAALRAEGVPAAQMYEGRPVYANPAVQTRAGADLERDRCPRTETLVARSVTIGIGPTFTPDDCDQIGAAVHKVARHVLGG